LTALRDNGYQVKTYYICALPQGTAARFSNQSAAPQSLAAVAVSRNFRWLSKKFDSPLKLLCFSAH
jgi:hypothetical protein